MVDGSVGEPQTTDELLKRLQEGNDHLFSLITGLEDSELEAAGVEGLWSVKDLLAHITHWNRHGIEWLDSVRRGETPLMPVKGNNMEEIREEMAKINATVHQENRGRPVSEVLEDYRETFAQVIDRVERLDEEHLDRVFDYPWASEAVTGRTVVMWRVWHQESHTKPILTWRTGRDDSLGKRTVGQGPA